MKRVLYQEKGISGKLSVVDQGRRRTMFLGSLPQTTIDTRNPDRLLGRYIPYFHLGAILSPQPERVLFLGLGGGAGVRSFYNCYSHTEVEAVEIDPNVVETAHQYFFLPQDSHRLKVSVADGRQFLTTRKSQFDHIILDAYNQDGYSSRLYTLESFQLADEALRMRARGGLNLPGVLLINAVGWLNEARGETLRILIKTVHAVFPTIYLFEVRQPIWQRILGGGNNFLLLASQEEGALSQQRLRRRAELLWQKKALPFDLRPLVSGWRPLPSLSQTEILTDWRLRQGKMILTV